MIDQDKMRALAAKLRRWNLNWMNDPVPQEAADAIDALLAEVEAAMKENDSLLSALAECREAMPDRVSCIDELIQAVGDPGSVPLYVKAVVANLRAELEAAAADKRDKPTLEMIRAGLCVVYPALYKESLFSEFDGPILRAATERRIGIMREQYKAMVDAGLAQRQGEGS